MNNSMNNSKIYLCKTDGSILGSLTGIRTDTCNLKKNATDLWEITFDVDRFIEKDGELKQSDFYDSIDDSMRLYFDSDSIQAYFIIDDEPVINGERYQEIKSVTAHSIECELNHIYLKNFKVNCGTYDSQEFLVTDDDGNLVNNINAYNANTMRWIQLVDYEDTRYSLMHLILENTDWTVKDNIPENICNIRKQYDTSNSVYAFLMKTVSPIARVIFEFDRKNKQIGIVALDDFGKDTGVFVTMRNLMKSFEITSSNSDAIMTKLIPTGADNLGIEQVNFGENYIINLDYFMNTLNEYGDYKFVSKNLHDKYTSWRNCRDSELVEYTFKESDLLTSRKKEDINFKGTRRELYREITKEYNGIYGKISEITNRVPNDGCNIDYKKFTLEELKTSLTAYENALDALLTLYKNEIIEEYGLDKNTIITINNDYSLSYSPVPSTTISPTLLPNSPYWYDYYVYEYKIIPQVKESLKMYCKTDSNGNLMVDENGHYVELEYGNSDYYKNTNIVTDVDGWLYEWSLYGLSELEAKKKGWGEAVSLLHKDCFVLEETDSTITYLTPDNNGWNSLGDNQALFTSKDAFISDLNKYLDYVSYDNTRYNSLTKQKGKGIIRQCEDAIADRLSEIEKLAKLQNDYDNDRKELVKFVAMKKFFSDDDILVINSILRTKDYENSNILVTNLDDVITTVDIQEELYQEALKELDKISQPQYSFKTELDNLYALEEFEAYKEPFEVGNFIRVGLETHEDLYDNNYIKLRLISIAYNPFEVSEDLSVEFSTMTKSLNTVSDFAFFLDEQGISSSSSGSSSSSSGGTYGNNDANVQMSTTMLNALLKTETFGTAISDVILDTAKANKGNFNSLFAHSGAFDSLEAGQIKISGDCLFDHIKSNNYESSKYGSYLNLADGSFELAGGQLKYDTKNGLVISGYSSSDDLSGTNALITNLKNGLANGTTTINGGCITTGNIKSKNYNGVSTAPLDNTQGSILMLDDGKFNFAGGRLKWNGTNLSINGNGKFTGEVQATNGKFNGEVNASSGSFNGNVTATTLTANQSGSIAGWNFNSNAFYKNSSEFGNANGVYLGKNGFSYKDVFKVDDEGFSCKSFGKTFRKYSNGFSLDRTVLDTSYVIVIYNDVADGESVDIRFQAYRQGQKGGNTDGTAIWSDVEDPCYSPYLPGYGVTYSYDNSTGLRFDISEFSWKIHDYDYMECKRLLKVWSPSGKQIKCIQFYNSNNEKVGTVYNPHVDQNPNNLAMSIDMVKGEIEGSTYSIEKDNIHAFSNTKGDFVLKIYKKGESSSSFGEDSATGICDTEVELNIEELRHKGVYNSTSSSGSSVLIDGNGYFHRSSSSSRRYKDNITTDINENLNPHRLYDIDVVQFNYKDGYLSKNDQRHNEDIIGFIAEDIQEKYPIACDLNNEGFPEAPNYNLLIAPMLKLIQEQHIAIEQLKKDIEKLKNTN